MKHISMTRVVILSILTLGFYELYWVITQRRALMKSQGTPIPTIAWPIAYFSLALISLFGILLAPFLSTSVGFLIAVILIVSCLVFVASIMRIVWMWFFIKAAVQKLKPQITLGWMIVHLVLVSFSVILILQYYANRKRPRGQKKPSNSFVAVSIVCICITQVFVPGILATIFVMGTVSPAITNVIQTYDDPRLIELQKQTYLLDKKYTGCQEKLDKDFPSVTNENEVAYNAGYDACEQIRLDQNKAVDDHAALLKELQSAHK